MSTMTAVWMTMRPQFLMLSLSVVLLGASIAYYESPEWSWSIFVAVLVGAVLGHIAVNMLNEYQDFRSGLDSMTQRTPFSGGSGALNSQPQAANMVLKVFALIMLLLTTVGVFLIQQTGWLLLPLGLLGLVLIVGYTRYITKMPWLCLIAPGIAFGPIMVVGTYYALTETLSGLVVLLSLVPFFLVNNLLLLNQIPDLEADKEVGRFNILMQLGLEEGIQIYAAFTWLAFIALGVAMWWFDLPSTVWLGFASLLIVFPLLTKLQEDYQNQDNLLPILGMNVIINLITPALIALGLFLSMIGND